MATMQNHFQTQISSSTKFCTQNTGFLGLYRIENRGKRKGAPKICDNCWIGTNSVIVGNVRIGEDVMIAPLTFVNFDVPPHSVVIGNPAKIIHKELMDNVEAMDRGLFKSKFYVINHTTAPAVLCEIGFLSNPEERNELINCILRDLPFIDIVETREVSSQEEVGPSVNYITITSD